MYQSVDNLMMSHESGARMTRAITREFQQCTSNMVHYIVKRLKEATVYVVHKLNHAAARKKRRVGKQ